MPSETNHVVQVIVGMQQILYWQSVVSSSDQDYHYPSEKPNKGSFTRQIFAHGNGRSVEERLCEKCFEKLEVVVWRSDKLNFLNVSTPGIC